MAILSFNYDKAITQASRVDEVAAALRGLANTKVADSISAMRASWSGESADSFLRHCEETKSRMLARASELAEISNRIRNAARALRNAETEVNRKMEELSRQNS
jgi:WXG100 family type VII secretion target